MFPWHSTRSLSRWSRSSCWRLRRAESTSRAGAGSAGARDRSRARSSSLATSPSRSRSCRQRRNRCAPPRSALSQVGTLGYAVITMIGTSENSRIRRTRSIPSCPGMRRSVTTRSGATSGSRSSAWKASRACATRKPQEESLSCSRARASAVSSTTSAVQAFGDSQLKAPPDMPLRPPPALSEPTGSPAEPQRLERESGTEAEHDPLGTRGEIRHRLLEHVEDGRARGVAEPAQHGPRAREIPATEPERALDGAQDRGASRVNEPREGGRWVHATQQRRDEARDVSSDERRKLWSEMNGEAVVVELPGEGPPRPGLEMGPGRPELQKRSDVRAGRAEHERGGAVREERLRHEGSRLRLLAAVHGAELHADEEYPRAGLDRRAPRDPQAVEGTRAAHEAHERAFDVGSQSESRDELGVRAGREGARTGDDHDVGHVVRGDARALERALASGCRQAWCLALIRLHA